MNNVRRLKARIKCNCNNHYLELLKTFDGDTYTYMKCCTKCGKWWTDTCSKHVHSYNNTNWSQVASISRLISLIQFDHNSSIKMTTNDPNKLCGRQADLVLYEPEMEYDNYLMAYLQSIESKSINFKLSNEEVSIWKLLNLVI